ncbi:unnamed protein product [Echinostoma caproni]|uniref:PH domain-containing protein n=1 Tax=Echinostoma caproni TaxID=27848 RepID=A0A183AXH3_9TREM|nr:unnamed protein product [Echinostoma caproni]
MYDHTSWKHHWKVTRTEEQMKNNLALCLSATPASDLIGPTFRSPWSRDPVDEVDEDQSDTDLIQSRIWSPPVRKRDRLGCLALVYSFRSGQIDVQPNGFQLAVLRRQEGGLCGWTNDLNSWRHRWVLQDEVENRMCCFSSKSTESNPPSSDTTADSPWLIPNPPIIGRKTKPTGMNMPSTIQSRLWSPAFPVDLKLQCLQFNFRVDVGLKRGSDATRIEGLSLALLQRREG